MKRNGKVVRFGAKGFGFITETTTRVQWFFHIKDVVDRIELAEGDMVSFVEGERRPGCAPCASQVTLISSAVKS
jgi:cold shock CspA family protein